MVGTVDGRDDLDRRRVRDDARDGRALDLAFQLGRDIIEPGAAYNMPSAHSPRPQASPSQSSDAPFDTCDHVPVQGPVLDDPEPIRAIRLDNAPPVRQHLYIADLEHCPKLVEKAAVLWRVDHPEARGAHLQTPSQHQSIPDKKQCKLSICVYLYIFTSARRCVGLWGCLERRAGIQRRGCQVVGRVPPD